METPARTILPLSQVQPARVNWLWEPFIPRGKLALLDGDPGVGKSLLTIDLAARLSRGAPLPDNSPSGRPHTTLLLSAEDGTSDTTRPRVEAAGADLDRVIIDTSKDREPFRFPADLKELEAIIRERQVDLVVIDPVMAFLPPKIAANNDQCLRTVFTPMKRLAEQTDCTILLVRHLRKKGSAKAIHRGLGSVAFIAASRAALLVANHPADPRFGILAMSKPNLTGSTHAFGFRIRGECSSQATIEWKGPLAVTADDLGLPVPAPLLPRERAAEWLHRELAEGPRPAADIMAAAARMGIPDVTLRRAKELCEVRSHQVMLKDDTRIWYWFDPSAPWPKDAPFERPFMLAPLRVS